MVDTKNTSILVCVPSETTEEISSLLHGEPTFHIEVVKTPNECLEKVRSAKFDILIMDVCFLKTQDELNVPLLHELTMLFPVILIGGEYNSGFENKIREEKIFYYVVKPIDPKELMQAVEEAIKWAQRNK